MFNSLDDEATQDLRLAITQARVFKESSYDAPTCTVNGFRIFFEGWFSTALEPIESTPRPKHGFPLVGKFMAWRAEPAKFACWFVGSSFGGFYARGEQFNMSEVLKVTEVTDDLGYECAKAFSRIVEFVQNGTR